MTDVIHEDAAGRDKTVKESGSVPYLHADDDLTCARCWPRAELIKHATRLRRYKADADRLAAALRDILREDDGYREEIFEDDLRRYDEALRLHVEP